MFYEILLQRFNCEVYLNNWIFITFFFNFHTLRKRKSQHFSFLWKSSHQKRRIPSLQFKRKNRSERRTTVSETGKSFSKDNSNVAGSASADKTETSAFSKVIKSGCFEIRRSVEERHSLLIDFEERHFSLIGFERRYSLNRFSITGQRSQTIPDLEMTIRNPSLKLTRMVESIILSIISRIRFPL